MDEIINKLKTYIEDVVDTSIDKKLKTPTPQTKKDLYTRKDLANIFGVTLATVHNWAEDGTLTRIKVGSRVYFKASEVEALMDARK